MSVNACFPGHRRCDHDCRRMPQMGCMLPEKVFYLQKNNEWECKMTKFRTDRRDILAGMAAAMLIPTGAMAQTVREIKDMKPGEFTWHPEASPSGVVAIIVSLPEQRVHVYRNGIRIGVSTCSTGKKGHETPTGVFTILQKDKHHHSSKYNNAPMPNMNRLTWSGVAMHAGHLPGYPASHGCIRLPLKFSAKLFEVTHVGTPVIVAGAASDPWRLKHPGLLLTGDADEKMDAASEALKGRARKAYEPNEEKPAVSVMVSAADKKAYLFEGGAQIAEAPLEVRGDGPLGEHVLMFDEKDGKMSWVGITEYPDPTRPKAPETAIIDRLEVPEDFRQQIIDLLEPGLTLIVTDQPATSDSRSDPGFVIMTTEEAKS